MNRITPASGLHCAAQDLHGSDKAIKYKQLVSAKVKPNNFNFNFNFMDASWTSPPGCLGTELTVILSGKEGAREVERGGKELKI